MATVKAATAKAERRQVTTAPKKPAAKVVRRAMKPSVVKHIAPPYSADEIRNLLGITEKDIQAARQLLRDTEEPKRKPRTQVAAKVKPAAAKLSA